MNSNTANTAALPLRARRRRKELGMTQQDVADMAGVSLRTYQLFENEQSHPQPANLRAIVDALGLDAPEVTNEPVWEPDIRAFLTMVGVYMEGLSDRERERFIASETRRIFQQARALPPAERDEAAEEMRAALARRSQPSESSEQSRRNA